MGEFRFRIWSWWRGPSAHVVWPADRPKPVVVPPRADLHNPEMKVSSWDVPALLRVLGEQKEQG